MYNKAAYEYWTGSPFSTASSLPSMEYKNIPSFLIKSDFYSRILLSRVNLCSAPTNFYIKLLFKHFTMLSFWYFPAQNNSIILGEGFHLTVLGSVPNPGPFYLESD